MVYCIQVLVTHPIIFHVFVIEQKIEIKEYWQNNSNKVSCEMTKYDPLRKAPDMNR